MKWLKNRMPDCPEAAHRMWLEIHRVTLTQKQKWGLRFHLMMCPGCRKNHDLLRWVGDTLKEAPGSARFDARFKMSPVQKERLRKRIDDHLA
ncbi:MAG: hypothetical protein AAF514_09750 [Verrucomicrobiota bacterium]